LRFSSLLNSPGDDLKLLDDLPLATIDGQGCFDRKMCLCSNARSVRIRPILQKMGESLAKLCRF
jgi:hypothetical protein